MKSVASSLRQAIAYINIRDVFWFTALKNVTVKGNSWSFDEFHDESQIYNFQSYWTIYFLDLKQLRMLGFIYFLHLFLYSGLEFTLTFLVYHKFHYTSVQQGWMYCGIGVIMALLQGLWIRRIAPESVQSYSSLVSF